MFSMDKLPLSDSDSKEFKVLYTDPNESHAKPRGHKITLKKVASINTEVLQRFKNGEQSYDNAVPTAITALNVVIRQEPSLKYAFNVRSFFTNKETNRCSNIDKNQPAWLRRLRYRHW